MTIGDVARVTGLATSAIRYYEQAGLLPPPPRSSKARRYDADAVGRVEVILLARDAGLTIAETRDFLTGSDQSARPAERWREFAQHKMKQLDAEIAQRKRMKALLAASFQCGCVRLEDCERYIGRKRLAARVR